MVQVGNETGRVRGADRNMKDRETDIDTGDTERQTETNKENREGK